MTCQQDATQGATALQTSLPSTTPAASAVGGFFRKAIILSWPPAALSPNAKRRGHWRAYEDAKLTELHGTMPRSKIAELLGRSDASLRARITRLGLCKHGYWSKEDEAALASLYAGAAGGGVLGLRAFAESIGRSEYAVQIKAFKMGLDTDRNRKCVHVRKDAPKFATKAELSAHQSKLLKKRIAENGHPRGFLGGTHSEEARKVIGQKSKAMWGRMTDDERSAFSLKAMKSNVAKNGSVAPKHQRGKWRAGWREFGGRRVYFRSRWEANYGRYLEWLKCQGLIADWEHEPETFWFDAIKRGVRSYLPDFKVTENSGAVDLHEVKGWMDARSKTTLKRMAKYHPQWKIVLIDERQYKAIERKVSGLIDGWEI